MTAAQADAPAPEALPAASNGRRPAGDGLTALASVPGPVLMGIAALGYFALAQYVIALGDPAQLGAAFWPAAGVSVALLLVLPARRWPWVLAGVAVGEVGGDLLQGYPLGGVALWTVGNVVEPLVGATLVRRYSSHDGALAPARRLLGFLLFAVIIGPLIGATIGSLGTIIFFGSPAGQVWPKYLVGDALGVLVMAPVLLSWRAPLPGRSVVEWSALFLVSFAVTFLVFRNWAVGWDVTLPYLIVPVLMWAALRFGLRGTALVGFIVANVANWSTATGYGPFAIAGGTEYAVTLLQIFLVITLTSAFVLASLAADLTDTNEARVRLAGQNDALQSALDAVRRSELHIRKLEGILPICMGCKSVRTDDDERWVPLDRYLATKEGVSLSHGYCPTCAASALAALDEGPA